MLGRAFVSVVSSTYETDSVASVGRNHLNRHLSVNGNVNGSKPRPLDRSAETRSLIVQNALHFVQFLDKGTGVRCVESHALVTVRTSHS
jgi:hypothetical protein